MLDLANATENGEGLSKVHGITYRDEDAGQIRRTPKRDLIADLDTLSFQSREMFDNESYKNYYKKKLGYTTTAIMTSRGCPFECDFCSRPVCLPILVRACALAVVKGFLFRSVCLSFSRCGRIIGPPVSLAKKSKRSTL